MKPLLSLLVMVLLLSFIAAGCSSSDEPSYIHVPKYPGASEDQEHDAKVLGMSLAKVKRLVTDDSYDEVLAFYQEHLAAYDPKELTHSSDDGRQTALTIEGDNDRTITVAVQEFKKDGKVGITYMRLGP